METFSIWQNEPWGITQTHLAVSTGTAWDHRLIKVPSNTFCQQYDKVLTLEMRKPAERWQGSPYHHPPLSSPTTSYRRLPSQESRLVPRQCWKMLLPYQMHGSSHPQALDAAKGTVGSTGLTRLGLEAAQLGLLSAAARPLHLNRVYSHPTSARPAQASPGCSLPSWLQRAGSLEPTQTRMCSARRAGARAGVCRCLPLKTQWSRWEIPPLPRLK